MLERIRSGLGNLAGMFLFRVLGYNILTNGMKGHSESVEIFGFQMPFAHELFIWLKEKYTEFICCVIYWILK